MKKLLEELWYGNITPDISGHNLTPESKKLSDHLFHHHEELYSTLNKEQKKIIEKYDDCYAELIGINERDIFTYGFKLGARIAIELMEFDFK